APGKAQRAFEHCGRHGGLCAAAEAFDGVIPRTRKRRPPSGDRLLRALRHQPKNIITMDSTTNTIAQILVISASLASMPLALFLPKKVSAAPLMAPRPLRSLLCKSTVTIITRADIKSRMPTIQ